MSATKPDSLACVAVFCRFRAQEGVFTGGEALASGGGQGGQERDRAGGHAGGAPARLSGTRRDLPPSGTGGVCCSVSPAVKMLTPSRAYSRLLDNEYAVYCIIICKVARSMLKLVVLFIFSKTR